MVFLNQNQLLGTIVPDVFISKITLETGARPTNSQANNPHIDLEKKPDIVPDQITGKPITPYIPADLKKKTNLGTTAKFLNSNTSDILQLNTTDTSQEKLIINVELLLKEKLDNGLVGTWFKNQNFSKYLKLKIIQSTQAVLTKEATDDPSLLLVIDKNKILNPPNTFVNNANNFLTKKLGLLNGQHINNVLNANINSKVLSVKDDVLGGNENLNNKYTEIDDNGNTITSFTFVVRFELNTQTPDHLSYFAFSYIDLIQLAKDFNFKLTQNLIQEPIGKIVSDIVIDNGNVVDTSFIYTDKDGAIWTGVISVDDSGNIIGIQDDNTTIVLNKVESGNSKVQDFRTFLQLDRVFLDFSFIDNEILKTQLVSSVNTNITTNLPHNTFSDLYLARDDLGQSRFYFSVNYKKLLEKNGKFGKVLKNRMSAEAIMNDSPLLSMKVFRRRVLGSPEIGSSADVSQVFDPNQVDDLLLVSGEKTFKNFNVINHSTGSLREVIDLHIDSTSNRTNLFGIRQFTGIDKGMSQTTDGYYIYGVEMEIEDGTYNFIIKRINELHNVNIKLNNYLQEALQPTYQLPSISIDPHIDAHGTLQPHISKLKSNNFDPLVNKFSQNFISIQAKKYNVVAKVGSSTPWGDAVLTYVNNLQLFSQNPDNVAFDKIQQALLYFTHPATGSPDGINKVIKLIETLENSLMLLLGFNANIYSGYQNVSADSPSRSGFFGTTLTAPYGKLHKERRSIRSFTTTKYFRNTSFNSNVEKNTGVDFFDLDKETDSYDGLRSISGEEYATRVDKENNKYFIMPNGNKPDINIKLKEQTFTNNDHIDNTSYSYLTPSKVMLANKITISRIGHSPVPILNTDDLAHLDIAIKSKNSNVQPIKPKSLETKTSVERVNQNILADALDIFTKLNIEPVMGHNAVTFPIMDNIKQKNVFRSSNVIDPIVPENTTCAVSNNKDITTNIINVNPTPILLTLANKLTSISRSSTLSRTNNKRLSFTDPTSFKEKSTISHFDLTSQESKINKVLQDKELVSSNYFFHNNVPDKPTISSALSKLPNQVKSLLLSKTAPTIVRKNWFDQVTDPIKTPGDSTEFRLDQNMIHMVQVFNGYSKSNTGEPILKSTEWIPLTLDLYNKSVGEALLCRLIHYENKILGINKDDSLEMPTYNEYFLLKPKKKAINDVSTNTSLIKKKIDFHVNNNFQFGVRNEFMSNNVVKSTPTSTFRSFGAISVAKQPK